METELEVRRRIARQISKERRRKRNEKAKVLWAGKETVFSFKKADRFAWKECAEYIRERDKILYGRCYWCGAGEIEAATHLISRSKRAIKFDERNLFGGCDSCNFKDSRVPAYHDAMVDIFISRNGVNVYVELVRLSKSTVDQTAGELMDLAKYFKEKREGLNG